MGFHPTNTGSNPVHPTIFERSAMKSIVVNKRKFPVPCRKWGVEIEVENAERVCIDYLTEYERYRKYLNMDDIKLGLNRAIRQRCGVKNYYKNWEVMEDLSLAINGREIISPPLSGEKGVKNLVAVCDLIAENNITLSQRCGLHIHVDVPNAFREKGDLQSEFIENLHGGFMTIWKEIKKVIPYHRRYNNNCRPLKKTTDLRCMHYRAALSVSYIRDGHVEFRFIEGCYDADKIIKWASFLCLFVDMVSKATKKNRMLSTEETKMLMHELSKFKSQVGPARMRAAY